MKLEEMLSTGQVARRFGVSQVAIRHWVKQGKLECVWSPLGRLFDPEEVERWAKERAGRR